MAHSDVEKIVDYVLNTAAEAFPGRCTITGSDLPNIFGSKPDSVDTWDKWTRSIILVVGWMLRNEYIRGKYNLNGLGKLWIQVEITDKGIDYLSTKDTALNSMLVD